MFIKKIILNIKIFNFKKNYFFKNILKYKDRLLIYEAIMSS